MEKLPADKIPEENSTEGTEDMNSEEVLSESAEITDNADSAIEASAPNEKPETSQMQSDTSGIEIVSASTTSASDLPHEAAVSEVAQDSPVQAESAEAETVTSASEIPCEEVAESAEAETVTSASEIPCEEVADSDGEDKTEPSSMQTEFVDELPKSGTSTAEIQSEGVQSSSLEEKQGSLPIESEVVSQPIASGSEIPCEQKASDAVKEGTAASSETSPRPKKSLFGKVKKYLSPTKSKKSKESRSKSMSPSDKTKSSVTEDSNIASEEACAASEGEEQVKNESEKTGMFNIKGIKRRLSKFSIKIKSSGTESKSLVTSEATERAEEPDVSKSKVEVETKDDHEQSTSHRPQWTNNRTSLTEIPSLGGTTMTDVPSTSSSSVFSEISSRKQSAAGENTSEEAVAGSLVSSPDEQIPDIKEDKGTGNESVKNDSPSSEEKPEITASEVTDQEQSSSQENQSSESKDEGKPDSEN